jgi:hypothetical protein
MAELTKTALKAKIDSLVVINGTGAITAPVLNDILTDFIDSLKAKTDYVEFSTSIITANYTVTAADFGKTLFFSGNITVTYPVGLTKGHWIGGVNVGTGTIALAASGGTLESDGTTVPSQYHSFMMVNKGSNVVYADGQLV